MSETRNHFPNEADQMAETRPKEEAECAGALPTPVRLDQPVGQRFASPFLLIDRSLHQLNILPLAVKFVYSGVVPIETMA